MQFLERNPEIIVHDLSRAENDFVYKINKQERKLPKDATYHNSSPFSNILFTLNAIYTLYMHSMLCMLCMLLCPLCSCLISSICSICSKFTVCLISQLFHSFFLPITDIATYRLNLPRGITELYLGAIQRR